MKQKCLDAQIVKREEVTGDLFKLWLMPEDGEKFTFKPGQYCTIGFYDEKGEVARDSAGKALWRPYSIVSAPHEEHIELFVELVPPPEGMLTPLLHKLRVGDAVPLLPRAKGIFTFEPEHKNHVMVATVTGIAPFMSMIRDYIYRRQSGHCFYILTGASYCDEFGHDDELRGIASAQSGGTKFVYMPTVSRPKEVRNKGWRNAEGRVNEIVGGFLDLWSLVPSSTIIYACGHPGMVQDVKKKLSPMIWKVKEEKYWK